MRSKTHTFFILVGAFAAAAALLQIVECAKRDFLENNCPKVCNPDGGYKDAEKG